MYKDALGLSKVSAGFIAVLVGYSSSAIIIFQAAAVLGATPAQISSWLWALGVGMGLSSIALSLYYKMPVLTAWSTPGAALLVTSLAGLSLNEAIGAFLLSSALMLLVGLSGWLDKLMRIIPPNLASAMLAGVLLQFGLGVFTAMESQLGMVCLMLAVFIVAKSWLPRYVILVTLLVGIGSCYLLGLLDLSRVQIEFAAPVWTTSAFSFASIVGVALPLFVVTMASQNVPGMAALHSHGYFPAASRLVASTGFVGVLLAPFGGFAFNLSAITAAICMGREVDSSPEKRYWASVWAGVFYLLSGLFGATVVGLFSAFPKELISVIAGLALLGTISGSLSAAMHDAKGREPALLTFLLTASGVSVLGIGSAFWGLSLGLAVYFWQRRISIS